MNLRERPYRDPADLERMRQLLVAGTRSGIAASYMHPGSLDWDIFSPGEERADRHILGLWDAGVVGEPELEEGAVFSRHEATFDLFVSPALHGTPAHETVMAAYVAWAEARAQQAGLQQISPFWVLAYDTVMDRLLRAHGFEVITADPPAPLFERSLATLPDSALPDGFVVQGVRNLADGRLRAQVTHSAFRPTDDWDGYWSQYAQFIGSAVYEGERDLFVRSPDGRGASACTIWFDTVNAVGLFEPVATHTDFQRLGLGKAVMAEGLRRMKAAGMRRAILGFDPNNEAARALYTSMGFQTTALFTMYRKHVAAMTT